MNPKILKDDSNYDEWCEQELLNAYKDAAESDLFLFGDYDYSYVWKDSKSNDVYWMCEGVFGTSFFINKTIKEKKVTNV